MVAAGAQQDGAGAQQLGAGAQQVVLGAPQLLHDERQQLVRWQQLLCLQHFTLQHLCWQQLRAWASSPFIARLRTATSAAATNNSLRVIAFLLLSELKCGTTNLLSVQCPGPSP